MPYPKPIRMDSEYNDLFDARGRLITTEPTRTETQYRPSRVSPEVILPSWVGTNFGNGDCTVFGHMKYSVEEAGPSKQSRQQILIEIYEARFVPGSPHCDREYIEELGAPCSNKRYQHIIEWLDAKIRRDDPRSRLARTKWECDQQWFLSHVPLLITD